LRVCQPLEQVIYERTPTLKEKEQRAKPAFDASGCHSFWVWGNYFAALIFGALSGFNLWTFLRRTRV
jgi:hypothetical protein